MKPEIVIPDFGGFHNSHANETAQRLQQAAYHKRQRIVVLVPMITPIWPKVYLSHCNLLFPPNNGVVRLGALGMEVGEAYSQTITSVLAHPTLGTWEYLLTLEHDNMPPADGVFKLIEQMEAHPEFACIGGLYFTKGEGGVAQIWGDVRDPVVNFRPQMPRAGELVECCGTGMGFNLWRMSTFRDTKLRTPWFKTLAGNEGIGTQDLYFWSDARKHGYRCAVDCNVRVGHYDPETDMIW